MLVLLLSLQSFNSFAAIQNIVATVSFDGTIPFDADNTPGNDAAENNKIIRTQDTLEYLISYEALDYTNTQIKFVLPAGVYWTGNSVASSVCNGNSGSTITGSGNVLICNRKPTSIGIESFYIRAIPGDIANGTSFTASVTAGTASAISEAVTVSATPKNELWWIFNNHTKVTQAGQIGVMYTANFEFGALVNENGNIRGYESLTSAQTITLEVGPGGVPYNCGARCSQPGGPGTPIIISLNIIPNFTRFYGAIVGSPAYLGLGNFRGLGLNSIQVFTPFDPDYPLGQITPMVAKAKNWDPDSVSGVSNFGTGYAPGYAPSFTCPSSGVLVSRQQACMRYMVDRTVITNLIGLVSGALDGTSAIGIFGDDNLQANHIGSGSEAIVVGQKFRALIGIHNQFQAEIGTSNAGACVVWDPLKMELFDTPLLKNGGGWNFFEPAVLNWSNVVSSNRFLEFTSRSFSNDTDRRNHDCGKAGDGNSEWFSSPSSVPGGMTAVSGIRYKYLIDLAPNATLGLVIPLVRPNTSYNQSIALGNKLPWFQQFYSDQRPLVKSSFSGNGLSSTGGSVVAFNSLFRAVTTVAPDSIGPGNTGTVTFTPIVIGPVGAGIDTVVKNATMTFNFPANNCLQPILSTLPAGAVFTQGNYGPDGIPCSGDAGETAGKITFNLGDLTAYSGAAGDASGHRTNLTPISFNIIAPATATFQNTSITATTAADTDPSPASGFGGSAKVNNLPVTINGVAAFSAAKSVSGVINGTVGPNEVFTYTINFGNGGTTGTGIGRFVDILPFDGDRNGTVALGTGKIKVVGLAGAMSLASQGTVQIQYTTENPLSVQSAISVAGNESGLTGVNWLNYSGGAVPADITAVRFVTSNLLNSGFSGYGSIQVKAPSIIKTSKVTNSVNARTDMINNDINTVKSLQKGSPVTITGLDAATLRGNVYYDTNINGSKDINETGVAGAKVVITCISGACTSALQGTVFSMIVDANGGYGFEPNIANKIFANDTATGTALSSFQGVIAGTWTITETPPTTLSHVNVSTSVGTINNFLSGVQAGRSITNVVMLGNGVGVNYNFGEKLADSKIKVTKALTLPSNVTGSFNFTFTATCDLPTTGSTYSATLTNYPTNTSVDILNIPANATCVMSETLPTAPNGYGWAAPQFSALTPTGASTAAGIQTTTATNALVQGVNVFKTVVGTPVVVSGNPTQFDVKYKIEVKNTTTQAVNYSVSDALGLDADVEVVGQPTVVASSNVSSTVNAAFTGAGTNKNLVTNESIAAGSVATPTIESFEITVRINIKVFGVANNTCNSSTGAGAGLSNQATLTVNGIDTTSTACTNTPTPATGKITVTKSFTRPSDVIANFNFDFKATCDLPTVGSVFTATLTGFPTTTTVDILNIPAGATCTVSETLPIAPNAYSWSVPVVSNMTPSGAMKAAGNQSITVTNALVNGLTIAKTVDAPAAVSGQPDQFDVTYRIAVTNSTTGVLSYDLTDSFGFDTDLQIVGTPSITKSINVSSSINSAFNGGTSSSIVTGESIAAASGTPLVPVIETYVVKLRVKVAAFNASNNICSGAGTGLFNTATAKVGGVTRTSSVCTGTPDAKDGKIVVTNILQLPPQITSPMTFTYKAKCDKPVADSIFTADLTFSSSNNVVEIPGIPAGAICVVSQVLPPAPSGYQWKTPVIGSLSPTGSMPAGSSQSLNVNNELVQGVTINKSVIGAVAEVTGKPDWFDVTYKIEVSNSTEAEVVYSLTDSFGFEPDVKVIGLPVVEKSANVSQNVNSAFTGIGTNTNLIASEPIAASVNSIPTVETYTVKVRIQVVGLNESNNSCENISGKGLFNSATMGFGSSSIASNTCIATPTLKPASFVLEVLWETGRVGAQVVVPGISFNSTSAASVLSSTNNGPGTRSSGDTAVVKVGEKGVLPSYAFTDQKDSAYHKVSRWNCDGVLYDAGEELTIPSSIAGRGMVCLLSIQGLTLETSKTAIPASGLSITPGDSIEYTLSTTLAGVELQEDFVLTDTLGAGLTFVGKAPDGCQVNAQVLTCTIPKRSLAGVYKFVYKATVEEEAANNSNPGVSNQVSTSLGACDKCATYHGIWTADTKKVSDAAGKKGVRIGDNIRYTVSVTIKNGPSSQPITVKDTRSAGLSVTKVPEGCSQKGRVMTCVVPSGSATGVYSFIYNATVTKEAGDYVTNKAVSDKGTCLTSCSTSVKVLKEVMLRVSKTSNLKQVKTGDFVRYEVLVENLSDIDANEFFILDKAAPGLSYVEGSVRVTGDASWSVQSNYPLKIAQLDLEASKKLTISYLMRVGAGAGRGKLSNQAWADDDQDFVSSNIATASVTRGSDPDFEDTHIMGVVFEDRNSNGIQDESEPGIAGARLTTAQGLIVETDAFGRYHIEGVDPGALARGSNYVVKLDTNSVPKGSKVTTQNPLVKRLTHGIPVVFNFGIR